jgi:two-component system NarL family sensor kinase
VRRLDRSLDLVEDGMVSISSVTRDLRPAMLDDLGLLPVLRSLVADFAGRTGIKAEFRVSTEKLDLPPGRMPRCTARAKTLSTWPPIQGVPRHGRTPRARRRPPRHPDDGKGPDSGFELATLESRGHLGLTGMRERMTRLAATSRSRAAWAADSGWRS